MNPESNNELARIESLLTQGKINDEEAALLIDAIVDSNFNENNSSDKIEVSEIPMPVEPTPPPIPKEPTPPVEPQPPLDITSQSKDIKDSENYSSSESEPTQWLSVKVGVGSVKINGKASLSKPVIKRVAGISTQTLQENDGDYSIAGGFSDMTVEMPSGMGLKLNVTAGDATVNNVAFLKGNNSVGGVHATAIGGLDFQVDAGEFTASALLAKGQHRLKLKAGSARLELLEGSSLEVSGTCNLGSFKVPDSFSTEHKSIRGNFEGKIGAGTGNLKVKVQAGEVSIVTAQKQSSEQ